MATAPVRHIWLHVCKRCGYQWPSYRERPQACANPGCRSIRWDKDRVRQGA